MLDTAFNKKFSPVDRGRFLEAQTENWSYVGRFLWGFARIEYEINQRFDDLVNLGAGTWFLTYSISLRTKIEVIDSVLKGRDIADSNLFKRIHKFHDLRNIIAHWPFYGDSNYCGEDGLWCDYADKHGTEFAKPGTKDKARFISYAELDSYDAEMSVLCERLEELPITPITADDRTAIEEAISSYENVLRFPTRREKTEEEQEE